MEDKYPQHAALRALNGANQIVGDFIEWLGENGLTICHWSGGSRGEYAPTFKNRDRLLAEFFEIDQDALSHEKDAMVEEMRAQSAP